MESRCSSSATTVPRVSGLEVSVLRGASQIGGNLIQVTCGGTKILLDAGETLEGDAAIPPQAAWLMEPGGCDAVFLTHTHRDHMGLAEQAHPDIPLYLGRRAWEILRTSNDFMGRKTPNPAGFLEHGKPIRVGTLIVTPYLCDHSAFDSYMLLVEGNEQSLLYTGDFRGHGRKSFAALLRQLPEQVDFLACEGTNLSRQAQEVWSEKELEERAVVWMNRCQGPAFVLQAATNLDRLVTFYRAAKRSNRIFLEDLYQAEMAVAAGPSIPQPGQFHDVRVFLPSSVSVGSTRYQRFCGYKSAKISRANISVGSVICIRPSMQKWLEKLGQRLPLTDSVLFYSLWSGYREKPEMDEFLARCREMGIKEVTLHSSGHATPEEIRQLLDRVHPKKIIAIHTLCPDWFEKEGNT